MTNSIFLEKIKKYFEVEECTDIDGDFIILSTITHLGSLVYFELSVGEVSLYDQFVNKVNNFDSSAEMEKFRQDKSYRDNISVRDGLVDFDRFTVWLKSILEEI